MKSVWLLFCGTVLLSGTDFRKDVQPLLEQNCTACHGSVKQQGGVRLDTQPGFQKAKPETVLAVLNSGAMPPGDKLLPTELTTLRDWIGSGAQWPQDVVIATGGAGVGGADNMALARRIHAKIAGAPAVTPPRAYTEQIPGTTISFKMVPIPAGEFRMGTSDAEPGHRKDEGPVHTVRIQPFWMSEHEVTWDEYRLFMFANQAGEAGARDAQVDAVSRPTKPYVEMSFGMGINGFPAIGMTQHGANKYAEWLSAKTGQFYRLPTEAEWEYACRANSEPPTPLSDYAWFTDNADGKYQKVMTKKPNAWGLYDMLGNVMEWTLDAYAPYQDSGKTVTEPWVKATKPYPHAVRGGSWNDDTAKVRCGARVASDPSWKQQDPQLPKSIWYHTDAPWLGFRVIRPVETPDAGAMYRYWNSGVEHDQ